MIMKKIMSTNPKEIFEIAKKFGVENDMFFSTTFKRYQKQLDFLDKLESEIDNSGLTVTKEYIKGRENVYVNPAIKEHTRIVDSANKTLSTLMKIITSVKANKVDNKPDPLLEILSRAHKV